MNKYMVKVINLFASVVEVEAESEDGAREKAKDFLLNSEEEDRPTFYEGTLPPKDWAVITKEKYDELKAKIESDLKEQGIVKENA